MKEYAIVESTFSEYAVVSVKRSTACGDSCAVCPAKCNTRSNKITVKNLAGASAGDKVVIEMLTSTILKSAFLVYIFPLIMLFLGYFVGEYKGFSQNLSVVFSLAMFLLTFLLLYLYDKVRKNHYTAIITEIIEEDD